MLVSVGFQPLERNNATFLCEAINRRYAANKNMIFTSNRCYRPWRKISSAPILVVALLDRLPRYSTARRIRGDSNRLKTRRDTGLPTPIAEASMRYVAETG